ncbi:hypothetical protein BOTBODRAFT_173137 [Botryobasidium botryosum FD-172 SS1]|uniref:Uncharacterized protein n=1 Tax=Botryobasidium botryosum (strain FD-172 SS1) TaxID=930990 RepID=A0A067MKZ9_BOTB1|nr:hypothetical protein BOTBODRAFT_173137 [Botryobasidium botryosum FD-172 SS1]
MGKSSIIDIHQKESAESNFAALTDDYICAAFRKFGQIEGIFRWNPQGPGRPLHFLIEFSKPTSALKAAKYRSSQGWTINRLGEGAPSYKRYFDAKKQQRVTLTRSSANVEPKEESSDPRASGDAPVPSTVVAKDIPTTLQRSSRLSAMQNVATPGNLQGAPKSSISKKYHVLDIYQRGFKRAAPNKLEAVTDDYFRDTLGRYGGIKAIYRWKSKAPGKVPHLFVEFVDAESAREALRRWSDKAWVLNGLPPRSGMHARYLDAKKEHGDASVLVSDSVSHVESEEESSDSEASDYIPSSPAATSDAPLTPWRSSRLNAAPSTPEDASEDEDSTKNHPSPPPLLVRSGHHNKANEEHLSAARSTPAMASTSYTSISASGITRSGRRRKADGENAMREDSADLDPLSFTRSIPPSSTSGVSTHQLSATCLVRSGRRRQADEERAEREPSVSAPTIVRSGRRRKADEEASDISSAPTAAESLPVKDPEEEEQPAPRPRKKKRKAESDEQSSAASDALQAANDQEDSVSTPQSEERPRKKKRKGTKTEEHPEDSTSVQPPESPPRKKKRKDKSADAYPTQAESDPESDRSVSPPRKKKRKDKPTPASQPESEPEDHTIDPPRKKRKGTSAPAPPLTQSESDLEEDNSPSPPLKRKRKNKSAAASQTESIEDDLAQQALDTPAPTTPTSTPPPPSKKELRKAREAEMKSTISTLEARIEALEREKIDAQNLIEDQAAQHVDRYTKLDARLARALTTEQENYVTHRRMMAENEGLQARIEELGRELREAEKAAAEQRALDDARCAALESRLGRVLERERERVSAHEAASTAFQTRIAALESEKLEVEDAFAKQSARVAARHAELERELERALANERELRATHDQMAATADLYRLRSVVAGKEKAEAEKLALERASRDATRYAELERNMQQALAAEQERTAAADATRAASQARIAALEKAQAQLDAQVAELEARLRHASASEQERRGAHEALATREALYTLRCALLEKEKAEANGRAAEQDARCGELESQLGRALARESEHRAAGAALRERVAKLEEERTAAARVAATRYAGLESQLERALAAEQQQKQQHIAMHTHEECTAREADARRQCELLETQLHDARELMASKEEEYDQMKRLVEGAYLVPSLKDAFLQIDSLLREARIEVTPLSPRIRPLPALPPQHSSDQPVHVLSYPPGDPE